MNATKYQIFLKTVECGSFTKAAADLNFSQSGISHAINSLEEELGVTLLSRNRGGVTLTGDGRAMAYRAGAELCNMEMPGLHAGVKYFCRNGQATWEGVLRDRDGVPIGPFLEKPDPLYGDITMEVNKRHIESYTKSARSPVYMDMTGLSREQLDLMEHWLRQEGNSTLLRHFRQEGIDMIDTAVEFSTYVLKLPISSGIVFNGGSETCVPGLYAAGDEGYGGISGAAVTGWWAASRNMVRPWSHGCTFWMIPMR